MSVVGCDCLYCRGEVGRRLVLVPFEIAEAAGLVESARKARVTIRPRDQVLSREVVRDPASGLTPAVPACTILPRTLSRSRTKV